MFHIIQEKTIALVSEKVKEKFNTELLLGSDHIALVQFPNYSIRLSIHPNSEIVVFSVSTKPGFTAWEKLKQCVYPLPSFYMNFSSEELIEENALKISNLITDTKIKVSTLE